MNTSAIMDKLIKLFLVFCSLLPVVLPCIYASELFLYDRTKDEMAGPAMEAGDGRPNNVAFPHNGGEKDKEDIIAKFEKEPQISKDLSSSSWDVRFIHAFVSSVSVIIVSELGDKTFFIAAIMAMRHSRLTVFIGAIGALGVMTVLAAFLGYATTVIPRKYTFYISTALFALFGLKMLKEGYDMDPKHAQEELEEVSVELKKKDEELEKSLSTSIVQDAETGIIRHETPRKRFLRRLFSPILLQSFTMTFLAEWGDRSQLTTIILAAREDPFGVTVGGTLGHAICTGIAVIGGRLIAQRISVRTVTIIGGVMFILFALSAFFFDPNKAIG